MNESTVGEFQKAIEAVHGLDTTLAARHIVKETFVGDRVWQGEVLEFESPQGGCYAWSVDGRITAVLKEPPINTPVDAVRAAIASENGA